MTRFSGTVDTSLQQDRIPAVCVCSCKVDDSASGMDFFLGSGLTSDIGFGVIYNNPKLSTCLLRNSFLVWKLTSYHIADKTDEHLNQLLSILSKPQLVDTLTRRAVHPH
jgi:hypothetical protein